MYTLNICIVWYISILAPWNLNLGVLPSTLKIHQKSLHTAAGPWYAMPCCTCVLVPTNSVIGISPQKLIWTSVVPEIQVEIFLSNNLVVATEKLLKRTQTDMGQNRAWQALLCKSLFVQKSFCVKAFLCKALLCKSSSV